MDDFESKKIDSLRMLNSCLDVDNTFGSPPLLSERSLSIFLRKRLSRLECWNMVPPAVVVVEGSNEIIEDADLGRSS